MAFGVVEEDSRYIVRGVVIDERTEEPLPGLLVSLLDRDWVGKDDPLGAVQTDERGEFTIGFGSKDFDDAGRDLAPDLYFVVRRGDRELLNTRSSELRNAGRDTSPIVLRVRGGATRTLVLHVHRPQFPDQRLYSVHHGDRVERSTFSPGPDDPRADTIGDGHHDLLVLHHPDTEASAYLVVAHEAVGAILGQLDRATVDHATHRCYLEQGDLIDWQVSFDADRQVDALVGLVRHEGRACGQFRIAVPRTRHADSSG